MLHSDVNALARKMADGEESRALRLLEKISSRCAAFSLEHRYALMNWLLMHTITIRPAMLPAAAQVLHRWPRSTVHSPCAARPRLAARSEEEIRLHGMFERLCDVAYAGEFPEIWSLRADPAMRQPGCVRMQLHHRGCRFHIDINPHFTPSGPILAHVLLHEMEHVHRLCLLPGGYLDGGGHGTDFELSLATHIERTIKAGVAVVDAFHSQELPAWWPEAVRRVLNARQAERFDAILALDHLGATDVFVLLAHELRSLKVQQVAEAYLGCVDLSESLASHGCRRCLPWRTMPSTDKKAPEGTTYALWRALGGS